MSIETFASYREAAHQHGRHLDNMLWNTIRTVLLLGSIIIAGATQVSSLSFTKLDGFLILLPLAMAFLVNLHALGTKPLLVPHPAVVSGSPRLDDPGRARRVHRYCMNNAIEENRIRKNSIVFSVASIGITLGVAGWWLGLETSQSSLSDLVIYWLVSALLNAGLLYWTLKRLVGVSTAASTREQSDHLLQRLVIDIEGAGTDVSNIDAMTKRISSRLRRIAARLLPLSQRSHGAGARRARTRAQERSQ